MSDMLKIINEMRKQPCLYDSTDKFHNDQKKIDEAYKKITAEVNKRASKKYTVKTLRETVVNLIKKYRVVRKRRMKGYYENRVLPEPPKWWIMVHYLQWDEKITKHVVDNASVQETKKFVKRYINKESCNLQGLKFDDGRERTEKDIRDMLESAEIEKHAERDFMIECLSGEPCLIDPKHKFYKNNKYKEAAYKRITNEMNKEFLDGYTIANVKLFIKVLREVYREIRHKRFCRYLENRTMSLKHRPWWGELHSILADETEDFLKDDDDGTFAGYIEKEKKVLIDDDDDTEFEDSSECDSSDDCGSEEEEEDDDDDDDDEEEEDGEDDDDDDEEDDDDDE
ncbi:altered inheritance of mitochondria protein 44 [Manduca sexta]|uniref:MADF domain-containing protein n=1 Tax=Manduca sexta TaxID=7130 RepID=A0A921Z5W7_MANSE|nr:altered inheritance of mitochondria protein 44 [Manduca sexta]KAG6451134.1 hypothetical protein O3G_MSEX006938 [Manduca sexta]